MSMLQGHNKLVRIYVDKQTGRSPWLTGLGGQHDSYIRSWKHRLSRFYNENNIDSDDDDNY